MDIWTEELDRMLDEDPGDVEYDLFSEDDIYSEDDMDAQFLRHMTNDQD